MKQTFKKSVQVLVLAGLIFGLANFVSAANNSSSSLSTNQGLTISPFLIERQMNKGESLDEIIDVTNNSDRTLPIDVTVNDFVPSGDNGQQTFLPAGQTNAQFSLASWIKIKEGPSLVLKPKEKTSLAFTITPPNDAEDGGHYGAILFSFQGPQVQGSTVQVTQKIGAIILVKLGKVNEDLNISKFQTEHLFYEKPPVTFTTTFNNIGNVHVKPRGGITIKNIFGKDVASVLVNENAGNVLPQSERTFVSTWNDNFAFGKYTADEKIVYGDSGAVVEASTTFWVLPWKLALGIAIGLFLLVLILVQGIRAYNRALIRKISATRRQK